MAQFLGRIKALGTSLAVAKVKQTICSEMTPHSKEVMTHSQPLNERTSWDEETREQSQEAGRAASMHMFQDTVDSIANFVNHALAILTLDTIHREMLLRRTAPDAGEEISQSFHELRREIKTIEAGLKAMERFSSIVCAKYPRQEDGDAL